MNTFLHNFLWCFIPIFVAIDVMGLIPLYVTMVHDFTREQRRKIIVHSLVTAFAVSIIFIVLGNEIFRILSITVADFQIAGGIVLLVLGILDLVTDEKKRRHPAETMGVVPLGVPLIVGPAVLSISLLLLQQYGLRITIIALIANFIIVAFAFIYSMTLLRVLGRGGTMAVSKIFTLLLVAIAVRMIRSGIIKSLS